MLFEKPAKKGEETKSVKRKAGGKGSQRRKEEKVESQSGVGTNILKDGSFEHVGG